MANTIKLRRSATPGKAPLVGDIQLGELALNTHDGKLYAKKSVSGVESIVDLSAGGGPIAETARTISADLTLSNGFNGVSVGPVEVAATYAVTVPANAFWVIL